MRTLLFGLLFVLPPFLKPWVLRQFCGGVVGKHVSIGWFTSISARQIELGDYAVVGAATLIRLDGAFRLGRQSEISSLCLVYGAADLEIGDQCYIGPLSMLNCDEPVRMGDYSALGPRSMVFTHGSFLPFTQGYWVKLAGVTIGSHVWCAAGVFLHPGVEIGDECFVNSRAVVTQSIPARSVAEGNPARVVRSMEEVRRKMSPRRIDAALQQVLRDFARVSLAREIGITAIEQSANCLAFAWKGRRYTVAIVTSTLDAPAEYSPTPGVIDVLLINQPAWRPLHDRWFDVPNLSAPPSADPVHQALRLFMQRYYGMRFTLLEQTEKLN